jgi:hypothetical protein
MNMRDVGVDGESLCWWVKREREEREYIRE